MPWRTLKEIADFNRAAREKDATEPPVECPHDGAVLTIRADGVRHCPMGNFTWSGGL